MELNLKRQKKSFKKENKFKDFWVSQDVEQGAHHKQNIFLKIKLGNWGRNR